MNILYHEIFSTKDLDLIIKKKLNDKRIVNTESDCFMDNIGFAPNINKGLVNLVIFQLENDVEVKCYDVEFLALEEDEKNFCFVAYEFFNNGSALSDKTLVNFPKHISSITVSVTPNNTKHQYKINIKVG